MRSLGTLTRITIAHPRTSALSAATRVIRTLLRAHSVSTHQLVSHVVCVVCKRENGVS